MRRILPGLLAIALIASVAAVAGGHGKKCTLSTQECLDKMAAKMKKSGWLGIDYEYDEAKNLVLTEVVPGGPAEKAGLRPGDVIHALNGISFGEENEAALQKEWMNVNKPGKDVKFTIERGGQDKDVRLTLGTMPADVLAKFIGKHMMEHAQVDVAAE